MATPAQLAEKLRQDRMGLEESVQQNQEDSTSASVFATPAQLAEKGLLFATPAQLAEKSQRQRPPPLPPRTASALVPPPAYSSSDAQRGELISEQWRSNDPRSSSTHSLVPSESQRDGRRKLLLVYIHGFMGNELSFQSFPAHTHNLLTIALADTHFVHTKLYPRYKSRNSIQSARDDFSNWLEPHESHDTDIILLGHSMGGILAAEVVLQQPQPANASKLLRHRILGMVGFDTPFLGMHPGVVVSGIGSLFRPAPDPPNPTASQQSSSELVTLASSQASISSPSDVMSTISSIEPAQSVLTQSINSPLTSPSVNDPYFDAPFTNDVHIPERKGWNNLLHFVNKHSDGLIDATKSYFMSHIEFGSCLADYPGMKFRYEKIRALEDAKNMAQGTGPGFQAATQQVRFINYYTASTGRPKASKILKDSREETPNAEVEANVQGPIQTTDQDVTTDSLPNLPLLTLSNTHQQSPGSSSPRQFDEVPGDSELEAEMHKLGANSGICIDEKERLEMRHIDSIPIDDEDEEPQVLFPTQSRTSDESLHQLQPAKSEPPLPPIPDAPIEPEPIDLEVYTDKDSRKIAEKEQKRVMKAYQQAVKDRDSAIKDRKKLLEKREKKAKAEAEKKMKIEEKQRLKEEKESQKRRLEEEKAVEKGKGKATTTQSGTKQGSETPSMKDEKPKRDKKFCMLPPTVRGKVDKCWVRIYMEGVDEVGAHCGLFWPGTQYESFVGDLGARIEQWVRDAADNRATLESGRSPA